MNSQVWYKIYNFWILSTQSTHWLVLWNGITFHSLSGTIFFWHKSLPVGQDLLKFVRFLDHTQRRTTVGRTPLHQWLARRKYFYLTIHNSDRHPYPGGIRTHNLSRQAAAVGRAATRTGELNFWTSIYRNWCDRLMKITLNMQSCWT